MRTRTTRLTPWPVVLLLSVACAGLGPTGPRASAKPRLTVKVPDMTYRRELPDFDIRGRTPKVFGYRKPPRLRFKKPDLIKWVRTLPKQVGRSAGRGRVRWYRLSAKKHVFWIDHPRNPGVGISRVLAVKGNTIKMVQPITSSGRLFFTQVGVCRWTYRYRKGLLRTISAYQCQLVGGGSRLYGISRITYWPGTAVQRHWSRYRTLQALRKNRWTHRVSYDRSGRKIGSRKGRP